MVEKVFKYFFSIIRIIKLKLKYKKRLKIEIKKINSLYIGKNVKFRIDKNSSIELGEFVYISDNCTIESIGGSITIGKGTFINDGCRIICMDKIKIGENTMLAPNVGIYDHDHCYNIKNKYIKEQGFIFGEIVIKDDVWIGSNSIIIKNSIIESRVVIGANSTIRGRIKGKSLYAGSPAVYVKSI